MSQRRKAAVIVLALFTAWQLGVALWRVGIMLQEGIKHGTLPLVLGSGLAEEVGLSLVLAMVAWWWLPAGRRSGPRWAIHFLVFAWSLALVQLCWAMAAGYFARGVSWATLGFLLILGSWMRTRPGADLPPAEGHPGFRLTHPALLGALVFWLLQAPHLFFTYHWTDTRDIWACRAIGFDAHGDLSGLFDCVDPSRPPLHSILLWLGHNDPTMEGRLLPFLMIGAFGVVVYHLLRQVAPRLAPWGVLWFFMTVRVYQGAVTSYADTPAMLAITIGAVLATEADLLPSTWLATVFAAVAGAAATLIKRDGAVMLMVTTAVVVWFATRRTSPRLYGALAGAALGIALWVFRPAQINVPDPYGPRADSSIASVAPVHPPIKVGKHKAIMPADTMQVTPQLFVTMAFGMQGQVLSHYGYGMFVPAWIILAIWVWRARLRLPSEARRWGWIGLLGWLAIVGLYVVNVVTGHPERATLYVIRTGFGRHLVHMFVFCLLHATALAAALVYGESADSRDPA
ncbi:MAG TPA: hypothetical protein VGP80_05295 [Gemmatimonadales bacterium]|nr:hypothetical protein [Gemmatimonadales bacterium]